MPLKKMKQAEKLDEAQRTAAYLSFLTEAVQKIGTSLDYHKTLKEVAEAMVPELSDWCGVDILSEDDSTVERLAIAHVDPKKVKAAFKLSEKYPPPAEAPSGTMRVIKTGEPMMANSITDDMLVEAARSEEHLELMRECDFHSMMIVPIKSRDKILGAITLVWSSTSGNHYSLADLAFAETLAEVAGGAIYNSRLYDEALKELKKRSQ